MRNTAPRDQQINIRITKEERDRIEEFCLNNGCSIASMGRLAVLFYLKAMGTNEPDVKEGLQSLLESADYRTPVSPMMFEERREDYAAGAAKTKASNRKRAKKKKGKK